MSALRVYVDTRSEPDRQRLLTADFVHINKDILAYKRPKDPGDGRKPVTRLRGLPPEVFLRAIWQTLDDYSETHWKASAPSDDVALKISLKSTQFRHDFDAGDADGDDGASDRDLARAFLQAVLGGLDPWLEAGIQIAEDRPGPSVELRSLLCPEPDDAAFGYVKTHTAEPTLQFSVTVSQDDDKSFSHDFQWCLPPNHPSRLLVHLCDWTLDYYAGAGNALPAFAVPHMPEVFLARDEEEVLRVFGVAMGSQDRRVIDLLSAIGIEPNDPALAPLRNLSIRFQLFWQAVRAHGFFAALDTQYDGLRLAFEASCAALLDTRHISNLHSLMLKAFHVVDLPNAQQAGWQWQEYLTGSVVTPLHPAVLDMIRHQHAFLRDSFCVRLEERLRQASRRRFAVRTWNLIADLAQINRPIAGTLDQGQQLSCAMRSYGYVHLVGACKTIAGQMVARMLLDYDDGDEQEVTDAELFRESRASDLVYRTLLDYRTLNASAEDGISVGAYCGREIQPVIAGIDSFLEETLKQNLDQTYGLQVTIYSAGRDDSAVVRWLDAWRDRWQDAAASTARRYYANCRISIAYRVVTEGDTTRQLSERLRDDALDITFFTDFIGTAGDSFEGLTGAVPYDANYRFFPVLEKACCAVTGGPRTLQRDRVLSQARFVLATQYSEVLARMQRHGDAGNHLVMSSSDFEPWKATIDAAHASSRWVVCIDPSVDESLLRRGKDHERAREIIGFGAGVGSHGESNYTISTEQYALADIRDRIAQQLSTRLGLWAAEEYDKVASRLVSTGTRIAGLSLIKATGPSEYVRDYVSYAVVRKMLQCDQTAFCDELVTLDSMRHWFDEAPEQIRPDLLHLQARVTNGYLDIQASVIECKLAERSDAYLNEAFNQVAAGLRHLADCFKPRREDEPVGLRDRPDRRYWWMQLHRLLASLGAVTKPRYNETLAALERLAEGLFTISWRGAVVAFWTDSDSSELTCEAERQVQIGELELLVPALSAGGATIRRVCLERSDGNPVALLTPITYGFRSVETDSLPQPETTDMRTGLAGDGPGTSASEPSANHPAAVSIDPAPEAADRPTQSRGKTGAAERVLLGHTLPGNRKVYWEVGHADLPNRHILIFGSSGTGKTYAIQAMLCELAKANQNSVIVDYTNGFAPSQLESLLKDRLAPKQHLVRRKPLPINPFRQQSADFDGIVIDEDPANTAQRVVGVFGEVYALGDQQRAALHTVIRDGIASSRAEFNLQSLVGGLGKLRDAGGPTGSSAATVLARIQPFVDMKPFGREDPDSWEAFYDDATSRCHVLQLATFSRDVARLITEFSLIDLYRYYRARGTKDAPRAIVLDEVQILDHRLDGPLGQLLTEGRKFGISLIMATQTLSSLDSDARDRLFQASHKLFFKPADTELATFARVLSDATGEKREEWISRLSSLARGECYSLGPSRNDRGQLDMRKYYKVRIDTLEQRY